MDGFELDLSPPLPPIAIGHGTLDPVIGVEWGRQAREVLEAAGAEVLYRETPMYHQIDPYFVLEVADVDPAIHSASRMKAAKRLRPVSRRRPKP